MKYRRALWAAMGTVSMTVIGTVSGINPAAATPSLCGTVLTQSLVLQEDVGPCSKEGFIIGADNVTLDLNGHTVFGKGQLKDGAGVLLENRTGVVVKGPGTIRDFDAGVGIVGGSGNEVSGLTIRDNIGNFHAGDFGDGIAMDSTDNNDILNNSLVHNGPFSGVSVFGFQSDGNTITGNTVTNNNVPMNPVPSPRNDKSVVNQDDGIRIEPTSTNTTIEDNSVSGSGLDGIAIFNDTSFTTVRGNTSTGNGFHDEAHRKGDGIFLFRGHSQLGGTQALIEDNVSTGNAANGIEVGGTSSTIQNNTATGNTLFDLADLNTSPPCDNNTWSGNTFVTRNQTCVN